MNRRLYLIPVVCLLLVAGGPGAEPEKEGAAKDLAKLQGKWRSVQEDSDGVVTKIDHGLITSFEKDVDREKVTGTFSPAPLSFKVERIADIDYCGIPNDPDRSQHLLDVYRPVGKDEYPVVFFVHGGGWTIGDKDDVFGVYGFGTMAASIARRGVVVVLPNYRLSPKAKHPDHIKDVARAFAWAHRNIARYGGRPDQIFACGHSAGGHLVSLLATDETYLKAEGLSTKEVKGVVSISGVYRVDAFDLHLSTKNKWLGVGAEVHPLASVFGDDPAVLKQASPLTHVHPGLPPFLLMYGGLDYCPIKTTTREFETALEDSDCEVDVKKVPWRTHETMLVDLVHGIEPATADALIRFVERHTRDGH